MNGLLEKQYVYLLKNIVQFLLRANLRSFFSCSYQVYWAEASTFEHKHSEVGHLSLPQISKVLYTAMQQI